MKHLFGVLLFLAIVIGAIGTYKFLVVPAATEIPMIEVVETVRPVKPAVRTGDASNGLYAIANKKRGEITIYVNSPESRLNVDEIFANFSVYAISAGKEELKMNVSDAIASARGYGASQRKIFTYKVDWLNDLEAGTNLYVMHKVSGTMTSNVRLAFSPDAAVAVLMKNE